MLVLSRRQNESIIVNHVVRVTVMGIRGNQVRLGIEAPRGIRVHRQEIQERIEGIERMAAKRNTGGPKFFQKPPVKTEEVSS